jgi:hypothetical protein
MKLRETMIAWTPVFNYGLPQDERAGEIMIVPHPDQDGLAKGLTKSDGACFAGWREASPEMRLQYLFGLFRTMTITQHMDPFAVDRAFREIDEYREAVSAETPLFGFYLTPA